MRGSDVAGSHSPAAYRDFVHVGPGTLAGRYLRRFWHPVARAQDLPAGSAKPLRILGEDFTLYRGEGGTPHVVAFRCAHRGTQLSTGWVEGDCIRCFYHGWKYDGAGQCVEQPAEDAGFAGKVKIESYPTEEYLGLVFAYLGEAERDATGAFRPPPLPRYREFEEPGVRDVRRYVFDCNYFNNCENGPDEAHVCFVHRDSSLAAIADVPRFSAEETDYGLVQYGTRPGLPVRVSHWLMPNMLQFQTYPPDPEAEAIGWTDSIAWRVPIHDEQHVSFVVNLAHVTGDLARRFEERRNAQRAQLTVPFAEVARSVLAGELRVQDLERRADVSRINTQDYVAQCGQGTIADREHERLGRSDVGVILLRKLWARELEALATGQPLKDWKRPERLAATSGV